MRKSASHGEAGYQRVENDAYFTPPWVTQVLLAAFPPGHFGPRIWEPACGDGRMVDVLSDAGYEVFYSDIHDYGYKQTAILDFLKMSSMFVAHPTYRIDAIITNPPFAAKSILFIKKALEITKDTKGKVAMLQRHEFDAPVSHHSLFAAPFAVKLVLSKRPKWNDEDKASPRFPYAWYVWDWQHVGEPIIRFGSIA